MKTSKTKLIEKLLLETYQREYCCLEVTIGFGTAVNGRVDFMVMDSKGVIKCFEIKVSKADFRSGNINSFEGDLNYYVMPRELFEAVKDEIPDFVGVYVCNARGSFLASEKRARRQKLTIERRLELTQFLARSLSREADRYHELVDDHVVPTLKKDLKRVTKERDELTSQWRDARRDLYRMENDIEELLGGEFLDSLSEKAELKRNERRRKIKDERRHNNEK